MYNEYRHLEPCGDLGKFIIQNTGKSQKIVTVICSNPTDVHSRSFHHNGFQLVLLETHNHTSKQHDLDIKLNHAREFLEKGHKVQFTVFFRGRQMLHKEHGYAMLDRITESLEDLSKVEQPGRMAGRRMKLLLVPK